MSTSAATCAPARTRFFQWRPTDAAQLAAAEQQMLEPISGIFSQHCIAGLNTLISTRPEHTRTVLLLHGFAGGVGCWVPNWRCIADHCNVFAVDLPGFARSIRERKSFASTDEVVKYYDDKLLAWMKDAGIAGRQIDIAGHSFGGYIAAHFAMRNPALISTLTLIDPWGVPEAVAHALPLKFRLFLRMFYCANPLSVLRCAGPWGPTLLPKMRSDFSTRWSKHLRDPNVFYHYTYHCNADSEPTGERAFQACCTGSVFASVPLLNEIPKRLSTHLPLNVIYGEQTWMDVAAGRQMVDAFRARGAPHAELFVIPDAGHQVTSDNAAEFNVVFLSAIGLASLM